MLWCVCDKAAAVVERVADDHSVSMTACDKRSETILRL